MSIELCSIIIVLKHVKVETMELLEKATGCVRGRPDLVRAINSRNQSQGFLCVGRQSFKGWIRDLEGYRRIYDLWKRQYPQLQTPPFVR